MNNQRVSHKQKGFRQTYWCGIVGQIIMTAVLWSNFGWPAGLAGGVAATFGFLSGFYIDKAYPEEE